jgi:hypothetical protein
MSIGKEGPLAVNAAEDELSDERIAVIPPVLVTENACEPVPPTVTLPRRRVEGLAAITPGSWALVPVPVTATVVGVLLTLLAMLIVPVALPEVFGANVTAMETALPERSCMGKEGPLALKAAAEEVTPESVTVPRLRFVTENDLEALSPICTLPKLKLVGLADVGLEALAAVEPPLAPAASTDPAYPMHPAMKKTTIIRRHENENNPIFLFIRAPENCG